MWRARHRERSLPARALIRTPATSMTPEVGASRPPIRLRSVVLPEPDGPINARNSPGAMRRSTPFRTSIRSPPRVKYLWTFSTPTSVSDAIGDALFGCDLRASRKIGGRTDHDALTGTQAGRHLDAIAVGTAGGHLAALGDAVHDDERVRLAALGLDRGFRDERNGARSGGIRRFILAQERHLDAHVGKNPRIELVIRGRGSGRSGAGRSSSPAATSSVPRHRGVEADPH